MSQRNAIDQYKKAIDLYQLEVDQYQRSVDIYISLQKAQEERVKNLFQLIVITALLPTFTSVLGYIFGTQNKN